MKVIYKGPHYTHIPNLTVGKVYEISATDLSNQIYLILCDNNEYRTVHITYFTQLDEHRDNLINDIINEGNIQ